MTQLVQVSVAAPEDEAAAIAAAVVGEGLAACAQVGGPVASTYWWNGKVEQAREWIVAIKTTPARVEELTAFIEGMHSYDVPEIVATPILGGSDRYFEWVAETVTRSD
jgi:periplasmic divalent cation tolerance protein